MHVNVNVNMVCALHLHVTHVRLRVRETSNVPFMDHAINSECLHMDAVSSHVAVRALTVIVRTLVNLCWGWHSWHSTRQQELYRCHDVMQ